MPPILALVGLVATLIALDVSPLTLTPARPVESVRVERTELHPGEIVLYLRNTGPEPVRIVAIFANEAVAEGVAYPSDEIPRLGQISVRLRYHWIEREPIRISYWTSNGIRFEYRIAAAAATRPINGGTLAAFGVLGVLVGVVPVGAGLLWRPALRASPALIGRFAMAFAAGVGMFLVVDSAARALELAAWLPGAGRGPALAVGVGAIAVAALWGLGQRFVRSGWGDSAAGVYMAVAVGAHLLGLCLRLGDAYLNGQALLNGAVVAGLVLHALPIGAAAVAAIAVGRAGAVVTMALVAVASVPAIVGSLAGLVPIGLLLGAMTYAIAAAAAGLATFTLGTRILPSGETLGRAIGSPAALSGLAVGLAASWLTTLLMV